MKKNTRKLLSLVCAALLLVCVTVGATFAYLTSTATVTNTFTVGNVKITMDEAKTDEYGGVEDRNNRVTANNYKLMPGHVYDKDPIVHVDDASEECWVFVKVENGIADIEADGDTKIAAQMEAKNWKQLVDENGAEVPNVYYYLNEGAQFSTDASEHGRNIPVFDCFKIAGDVSNETLNTYSEDKSITITAYAIQADGFENEPAKAWQAGGWN